MWSGNMTGQGESYPTQWALNPSAQYLHMPQEQVDWASLAQQWIKMKEENPQLEKEQGEAPMEITKEEVPPPTPAPPTVTAAAPVVPNAPAWPSAPIPTGSDAAAAASWWGWGQTGASAATWGLTGTPFPDASTVQPAAAPAFSFPPAAPPAPEYVPPPPTAPNYWNEVRIPAKDEPPAWESRNHRKSANHHHTPEPAPEIDAVKRKQLPAWIREGLEKMEREKLKKAESERLERERKEALMNKTQGTKESSNIVPDGNGYEEPPKSKFETDSSESEAEEKVKPSEDTKPRKSRFDVRQPSPPKPVFRTKEQILQAVMTDVRKILTHILMEVTTEEIKKACEEVNRQFSRKAPATALRKTQALTSLTGKLGLGIYGSDTESEDSGDEKVKNDPDSDQELKEKIERLKSEFVNTEKFIEREFLEQEEREKRQLLRERRESSEEGDHSQVHSHSNRGPPVEKSADLHPLKVEESQEHAGVRAESRVKENREVEGKRSPNAGGKDRSDRGSSRSERKGERGESRSERGGSRSERSERGGSRSERARSRSRSDRKRRRKSSSSSSSESSSSSSSSSDSSDESSRRRRKRSKHHHRRHHRHRSSSRSSSSSNHRHSRHHRR